MRELGLRRWAVLAGGVARPRSSPSPAQDGKRFTNADLRGASDRPRLLSVRVLAGLHGPVLDLRRGCSTRSRRGRQDLRRVLRRDVLAGRRSAGSSASTIEQLSDFEPKGDVCEGLRRYCDAGGFSQRALVDHRPGRHGHLELGGAEHPGMLPAPTSSSTGWARGAEAAPPGAGRGPQATPRDPDARSPQLPRAARRARGPGPRAAGRAARRSCTPTSSARSARRSSCACATPRCACASATSRCGPRILARGPPPRRRRPRRPGGAGRCTTRCSLTRAGWRTRTCGRAPSTSASTWSAFTPTAAAPAAGERMKADFRGGIRAGVATTPTVFLPDGERVAGRPDESTWARLGVTPSRSDAPAA